MEQPLLDVAMIVKDEEHFLPGCLESIATLGDLVHEVCIYDTGSTDRTIEIAEAWGARVQRGYWDDDFARARNESVAMCAAKWVLVIDADERVVASALRLRAVLRQALVSRRGLGVDVMALDQVSLNGGGLEILRVEARRLIRPTRGVFHSRVHEVFSAVDVADDLYESHLPKELICLRHLGYSDEYLLTQKIRRNARAAELGGGDQGPVAEKAYIDFARSLMRMEGQLDLAVEQLFHLWKTVKTPNLKIHAGEILSEALLMQGRYYDLAALVRELRAAGSSRELCDWMLGRARVGQGRHHEALALFQGINQPEGIGSMRLSVGAVLDARLQAAAECEELDEVFACALALMLGHGRRLDALPLLLAIWGERPSATLAELCREVDRGHLPLFRRELEAVGESGQALLAALDRQASAVR